jgi:hypothetical protein
MDVEQAGEILVHGIERRPRAIEIEPARLDFPAHHFREDRLAIDDGAILGLAPQRADIAIVALRLAQCQFAHDIVGAAAAFGVAGLLPGQHQRRHVMAQRMPGDRVGFPAAIDRRLGLEPGIFAEIVKEAIGAERHQVLDVDSTAVA